jgi:hypothetical protein
VYLLQQGRSNRMAHARSGASVHTTVVGPSHEVRRTAVHAHHADKAFMCICTNTLRPNDTQQAYCKNSIYVLQDLFNPQGKRTWL